jgi:hypothetical protein
VRGTRSVSGGGDIIRANYRERLMKDKLPYIIFAAFLAIFTVGLTFGRMESLLDKAIRICLECIGIG